MKNLIKINPASFILGAIVGGITIFTIAADSQHPAVWNYKVVEKTTSYKPPFLDYAGALNQAVVENNGWDIVGSQFIPDNTRDAFKENIIKIVLRQPRK